MGLGFFKFSCSKISFPTGEENVVGFFLAIINVKFVWVKSPISWTKEQLGGSRFIGVIYIFIYTVKPLLWFVISWMVKGPRTRLLVIYRWFCCSVHWNHDLHTEVKESTVLVQIVIYHCCRWFLYLFGQLELFSQSRFRSIRLTEIE